jgi:RNA polymerase sigma-70 factor (ECF subfamily)
MPDDGEVAGLLALMLLTEARRTARVSANGELVPSASRTVEPGTRR